MRYRSLDALRGVAALVVMMGHCTHLIATTPGEPFSRAAVWLGTGPAGLAVNANAAVTLFFVLSGFVLANPNAKQSSYPVFAAKRALRIWLPFSVAILLSVSIAHMVGHNALPGASPWFNSTWQDGLGWKNVARNLTLSIRHTDLDNVSWSLAHELRISLTLPVLIWLSRRGGALTLAAFVALNPLCVWALSSSGSGVVWNLCSSGCLIYLFIAGILLAQNHETIRRSIASWPVAAQAVALLMGLAAMSHGSGHAIVYQLREVPSAFINALGATAVIALCSSSPMLQKVLEARPPLWLGRISYSLYLVHVPIIVGTVRAIAPILGLHAAIAIGATFALIGAHLFQAWVEGPSHSAAQRLGAILSRGRRERLAQDQLRTA